MLKKITLSFAIACAIPLTLAAKSKSYDQVTAKNLTVCNNATVKGSLTAGSITTGNETVSNNLTVGGTVTANNVVISNCTPGTPGVPCLGGALGFGSFYFLQGGAFADNPDELPPGTTVIFPRISVSPIGVTTTDSQDFTLTNAGIYAINWVVNIFANGSSTTVNTSFPDQMVVYANGTLLPQTYVGGYSTISIVPAIEPPPTYFSVVGMVLQGSFLYEAAAGDVISLRTATTNNDNIELETGEFTPMAGMLTFIQIA